MMKTNKKGTASIKRYSPFYTIGLVIDSAGLCHTEDTDCRCKTQIPF